MNLSLIGPSGVGKGTHALTLIQRFGLIHLATGELFRDNVENRTALGILASAYMSHGELVPDEIVDAMIEERLRKAEPSAGFLFDGFPRTLAQAHFVEETLRSLGRELDAVVYLQTPDDVVVQRLSGRLICHKCHSPFHRDFHPFQTCPIQVCHGEHLYQRPDDTAEMVRLRLHVFHRTIGPVVDHFQRAGKLIILDADRSIDEVGQALLSALTAISAKTAVAATAAESEAIKQRGVCDIPVSPTRQVLRPTTDLVLLGGPGSGKGTQAEHLARTFHLPHIATGDLFRENLKNDTDLGKLARSYMNRGDLVPDHITEAMVRDRLERADAEKGFILDGFPRTLPQAESLTEMLQQLRRRLAGVLYINVSDDEIVRRLSGRLICKNCQSPFHLEFKPPRSPGRCDHCGGELYQRADDNPETIRARLKTFHRQTEPLTEYYQNAGVLCAVDGTGPIDEITRSMLAAAQQIAEHAAEAVS